MSALEQKMKNKRLIVVLGMHRSGTSAVTRGLQVMGVGLGDRLMSPVEGVNPTGFWEDIDLNALNIEMMEALGSDWHHLSSIEADDVEALREKGYFLKAVELLHMKIGDARIFGLKDPRVSKLLPFWNEVFRHCELDVSYVLAVRHPLSVVKSLARRDGFDPEKSYLLWLGYVLTSLSHVASDTCVVTDYDRLIQSPDHELSRIAESLKLKIDSTELQSYKTAFLDDGLRHTVYELNDLWADRACPPLVREIYAALLDVASDRTPIDDSALQDQIARWSGECERIRSPLALADRLERTHAERAELLLAEKDAAWSARIEQTAFDFRTEIARIAAERDGMLADKDAIWSARVEQTAIDFQAEIARITAEQDRMLTDKDGDWSSRVEQTAFDVRAEIARIALERDRMLADKDTAWEMRSASIAPKVSVITVNYNGERFLANLLRSIANQTLRPAEVIVVDNASSDGSVELLRRDFPWVRVVQSDVNLGFAAGNNLGVASATHPLVALINNDTIVDPHWLELLVAHWVEQTARGERVGAVGPKIRFLKKFLSFEFSSETFTPPGGDTRSLGVAIDLNATGIAGADYLKPIVVSGTHGEERWPDGRVVRWTNGKAKIMLPVPDDGDATSVLHVVASAAGRPDGTELTVSCEGNVIGACRLSDGFTSSTFTLSREMTEAAYWVVNNAGSRIDSLGNAGDIGINQRDDGRFEQQSRLEAFCGCSVLIGREQFISLGGFDESFFMYYEDADLSWRMRRAGLSIHFEPRAVVRHIHAGSSGEWSPGFRYHVVRNQRLIGFKNAPLRYLPRLGASLVYAVLRTLRAHGITGYRHALRGPISQMTHGQINSRALHHAIRRAPRLLVRRLKEIVRKAH